MKAPEGLLSDRTVLRSKMEGPHPDKFAFAQRSGAMKAPEGLLSDRTVLRSKMEGPRPDKFQLDRSPTCYIPSADYPKTVVRSFHARASRQGRTARRNRLRAAHETVNGSTAQNDSAW